MSYQKYLWSLDHPADFEPDGPNEIPEDEPLPEGTDYFTPPDHPLDDGTCDTGEFEISDFTDDDLEDFGVAQ